MARMGAGRRRLGWTATWVVAGTLGITVGLLLGSGPVGVGSATPVSTVQPWTQYDTGRVNVVFPSQLPAVELVQDANSSVSATLQLTGVYEIGSTGFPHPMVVAAAFPSSASAFNGSSSPTGAAVPTTLSAMLTVYPVGTPLWNTSNVLAPVGAPRGATGLTVSYGASTSSSVVAGVGINWSVSGWPWLSMDDLLALRFSFAYASGASLTACTGSSVFYHGVPPCAGETVTPGAAVYGSGFTSFEGENGTGPVAVVSWGSSEVVGTTTAPVTAAAYALGPGQGEVLLAAPSSHGSSVTGTMAFSLVAPAVVLSSLLHGNMIVYGGAAAVVGVLASVAIVSYRRRDRRLRESL